MPVGWIVASCSARWLGGAFSAVQEVVRIRMACPGFLAGCPKSPCRFKRPVMRPGLLGGRLPDRGCVEAFRRSVRALRDTRVPGGRGHEVGEGGLAYGCPCLQCRCHPPTPAADFLFFDQPPSPPPQAKLAG